MRPAIFQAYLAACIYADDLCVCDLDGKNVRRLTSDSLVEALSSFTGFRTVMLRPNDRSDRPR